MKQFRKECFGSILDIQIEDSIYPGLDKIIDSAFGLLDSFEEKYSRFKSGNLLSELNRTKKAILPDEIIDLIVLSKKISKLTQGYYDITMVPILENNGYGIHNSKMNQKYGYQHIDITGNVVTLGHDVCIEFGSLGKGYALDLIYNTLDKYSQKYLINFGGDIRVKGSTYVYLEDPLDAEKYIGKIEINNGAIATSGGNKRILHTGHHLIDPYSQKSQEDKLSVYVTHSLGVLADIFATALYVCPLDIALKVLDQTPGLEALIITSEGKMFTSQGFNSTLNI